MQYENLIADLERVALGVACLHHLEESQGKKNHLDNILADLLRIIEEIEDGIDDESETTFAQRIWNEVAKNFVKYGLEELFERLFDFGVTGNK